MVGRTHKIIPEHVHISWDICYRRRTNCWMFLFWTPSSKSDDCFQVNLWAPLWSCIYTHFFFNFRYVHRKMVSYHSDVTWASLLLKSATTIWLFFQQSVQEENTKVPLYWNFVKHGRWIPLTKGHHSHRKGPVIWKAFPYYNALWFCRLLQVWLTNIWSLIIQELHFGWYTVRPEFILGVVFCRGLVPTVKSLIQVAP